MQDDDDVDGDDDDDDDDNDSLFLYSAFQDHRPSQSTLQIYIITPVIGFRLTRTKCMHILYSLGEHSSQVSFLQAHICFRILPGTHLTCGWGVANVDQCLAEGH